MRNPLSSSSPVSTLAALGTHGGAGGRWLSPMWRDLELEWAQAAATPCPLCGEPRRAFHVKKAGPNYGKLFFKCQDQECGAFEWVPLPVVAVAAGAVRERHAEQPGP